MDLDAVQTSVSTLKKNGYKILNAATFLRTLSTYGIESIQANDPAKAKHTETTQRFKVQLHLSTGEILPTKIEFSRRQKRVLENTATERIDSNIAAAYQKLPFLFQHYARSAAIVQKIHALAHRTVTQTRDLFDLYILKLQSINKEKIKIPKDVVRTALKNIENLSNEDFQGHVINFLNREHQKQFESSHQWKTIIFEISKMLRSL